jgi:hypothetical protein
MTQKMTRAHYKILKYTVTKTHQKVLELSKNLRETIQNSPTSRGMNKLTPDIVANINHL